MNDPEGLLIFRKIRPKIEAWNVQHMYIQCTRVDMSFWVSSAVLHGGTIHNIISGGTHEILGQHY